MPRSEPSFVQRSLEPLVAALWPLFLASSAFVAVLWFTGNSWSASIGNPGLRAAVKFILQSADAGWLLLGALIVYLQRAEQEGIARARLSAAVIIVVAWAVAQASVATGFPLGSIVFTSHLGARVGSVPLGWLLLWFIVVLSGQTLVAETFRRISHAQLSVATGLVASLTITNLDPLATKLRLFWFWYRPGTHTPTTAGWQNFLFWFAVTAGLAWFAREHRAKLSSGGLSRAALVILMLNAVFGIAHLRWVLRF